MSLPLQAHGTIRLRRSDFGYQIRAILQTVPLSDDGHTACVLPRDGLFLDQNQS